jgi:hypothetical protein
MPALPPSPPSFPDPPEKTQPRLHPARQKYTRATTPGSIENDELDIAELATRPEPGDPSPPLANRALETITGRPSLLHILERLFTFTLLFLILAIVILIVAAMLSSQANIAIIGVLHIDIRAELATLWQLIRQIHF